MGLLAKQVAKEISKIQAEGKYEYNTILAPNQKEALSNRFTRTMLINGIWYGGNDLELKKLYEKDLKAFKIGMLTSDELNYFWAQPTEGLNIRKIHSGLPQLISEKMVDLLLSNGYEYSVYMDEEMEDEDEENKERLDAILEDNDFVTLLQEAIETESWGGGVAIKLSTNKDYEYPIIEIIQPDEYEPTIEFGRIKEDVFITYYNRHNLTYKLKEIYGKGYIKFKLYKNSGSLWVEADLSELKETKDLEDIPFKVNEKFSIYKPNKLPNSEFRGSRLGESDYSGSHGIFDAIDEVLSTMVQEFRDGKIKNFWPSSLLPIDPVTNTAYMPPSLKKDFITYNTGVGEKEKPIKPEMIQGDIHSEKYLDSYKKLLESALNNAGLSPQSIGVTGLESVSASEESQELREKTSIRTREKKVDLWTSCLNELFRLVLVLDDIKNNRAVGDYITRVVFNDYKIQTVEDKTDIATKGIIGKAWSIKNAVQYIHDEMTPEEQILECVNIKIENGINVFTKEEEEIYKKFVMEVQKQDTVQPDQQQQTTQNEQTNQEDTDEQNQENEEEMNNGTS